MVEESEPVAHRVSCVAFVDMFFFPSCFLYSKTFALSLHPVSSQVQVLSHLLFRIRAFPEGVTRSWLFDAWSSADSFFFPIIDVGPMPYLQLCRCQSYPCNVSSVDLTLIASDFV